MKCCILTLYPEMFPGVLGYSLAGAGLSKGVWSLNVLNIRDFAGDRHQKVDDTPYGGGAGMVMKPDVISNAIESAYALLPQATLLFMTPRGNLLKQSLVKSLATETTPQEYIILCGRFEGIDERVIEEYQPIEISLGDYILFGGEVAAQALIEAMLRYIPGILGNHTTTDEESFTIGEESACLLEYPHYTKPPLWKGRSVPDILLSGHHGHIKIWRAECAEKTTRERRPDLWKAYREKTE